MSKPVRQRWSWMVPEEEIVAARTSGLGTVLWMMVGAALIFVALLFVLPAVPKPAAREQPVATSRPAITPQPTTNRPAPSSGGGGSSIAPVVVSEPLPDCAGVQDTRTACIQSEQPTVEATALQLAPAAIECWQGSFYTCEELAEMGDSKAVEAVQEADQFLDTSAIPTAPPAFVNYATNACAQATTKSILCP